MKFRHHDLNYKNHRILTTFSTGIFVYANNYIIISDDNFDKLFKVDKRMGSYMCMKWGPSYKLLFPPIVGIFFIIIILHFFPKMLDCRILISVNVVKNNSPGKFPAIQYHMGI